MPRVDALCETIRRLFELELIIEFKSAFYNTVQGRIFYIIMPLPHLLFQNASENIFKVFIVLSNESYDREMPLEPHLMDVLGFIHIVIEGSAYLHFLNSVESFTILVIPAFMIKVLSDQFVRRPNLMLFGSCHVQVIDENHFNRSFLWPHGTCLRTLLQIMVYKMHEISNLSIVCHIKTLAIKQLYKPISGQSHRVQSLLSILIHKFTLTRACRSNDKYISKPIVIWCLQKPIE